MKQLKFVILFAFLFIAVSCASDDGPSPSEGDINNLGIDKTVNRQQTGSSANDFLSALNYSKLNVELVYVEGFQPTQGTIDNLGEFLQERLNKPKGITINIKSVPAPQSEPYSIQQIADFEDEIRTTFNTDDELALWIFFANSSSEDDEDNSVVLGTAYRNTSFVIFEKTVRESSRSPLLSKRTMLESAVVQHELGHILGLTNFGTPMQQPHEDSEHERHCDVESCLMYWAINSQRGIQTMMGEDEVPDLDPQCIEDLRANGGR